MFHFRQIMYAGWTGKLFGHNWAVFRLEPWLNHDVGLYRHFFHILPPSRFAVSNFFHENLLTFCAGWTIRVFFFCGPPCNESQELSNGGHKHLNRLFNPTLIKIIIKNAVLAASHFFTWGPINQSIPYNPTAQTVLYNLAEILCNPFLKTLYWWKFHQYRVFERSWT